VNDARLAINRALPPAVSDRVGHKDGVANAHGKLVRRRTAKVLDNVTADRGLGTHSGGGGGGGGSSSRCRRLLGAGGDLGRGGSSRAKVLVPIFVKVARDSLGALEVVVKSSLTHQHNKK